MENKNLIDMTAAEILAEFAQAIHEAVKRTHEAGLTTTHADGTGIYELYPDGKKVYKKLYGSELH